MTEIDQLVEWLKKDIEDHFNNEMKLTSRMVNLEPLMAKEQLEDVCKTMALHAHTKMAMPFLTPEKIAVMTTKMKTIQEQEKENENTYFGFARTPAPKKRRKERVRNVN